MRAGDVAETDAPDLIEVAAVTLALLLTAVSWVALLLAWAGRFRALPLALLSSTLAVATLFATIRSIRRRQLSVRWPTRRSIASSVVIAIASAWLFFPPSRYHFDGSDGSVYAALAAILERHGTLTPVDALAASAPEADRSALFPLSPPGGASARFPGGLDLSTDGTRLRPEFLHLFPIWMATADLAFGPAARWLVNPALASFGVLLIWLVGRRLSCPLAGEIAAGLLAVNLAQVWFGRFPTSEMTAQFLIVAGLYFMALATDTRWPAAGAAAGAMFGLLAFARVDMLVMVTPLVALSLILERRWGGASSHIRWAAVAFAALITQGAWYALTVAQTYSVRALSMSFAYAQRHPERAFLAGTVVLIVVVVVARVMKPGAAGRTRVVGYALAPASVVLLGALLWRDRMGGQLQALLTPVGAVLGLLGIMLFVLGPRGRRAVPAGLLLLGGLAYIGNPMDDRTLPWALRRYVPILLPLAMLGVAHAVVVARERWNLRVVLLVPVVLGGWFVWNSWPIIAQPLMQGASADIEKITRATESSSLLVWDAGTPSHLAMATHVAGDRQSYLAPYDAGAGPAIRRMVVDAIGGGRAVYLIVDGQQGTISGQPWPERLAGLDLRPAQAVSVRSDRLVQIGKPLEFWVDQIDRRLHLYAVRPAESDPPPLRLDVGEWDLPYLGSGFYPAEKQEGAMVRWTASHATVQVPPRFVPSAEYAQLVLRLATRRPGAGRVPVELDWNGQPMARVELTPEFAEYRIALNVAHADRGGALTLRSPPFVPREVGLGEDRRSLGVLVDWIAVEVAAELGRRGPYRANTIPTTPTAATSKAPGTANFSQRP